MKKIYKISMIILFFSFVFNIQVFASRVAPAKISPIIYNDIRIVAENYSPEHMGVIQAFNIKTNKLVWSKRVYTVLINPFVEEDTQWAFIKEMKIEMDKLIVVNEEGKVYTLDPNTGENFKKYNPILSIIATVIIVLLLILIINKRKSANL